MKKNINRQPGKKYVAVLQILILLVSTVAFSYMIGSEVKIVSAEPTCLPGTVPFGESVCCAPSDIQGNVCNKPVYPPTATTLGRGQPPSPVANIPMTVGTGVLTDKIKEMVLRKGTTTAASSTGGSGGIFSKLGLDKLGFERLGPAGKAVSKYTGVGLKAIGHNLGIAALIYVGTNVILRAFGVDNELANDASLAVSLGYLGYEVGFAIAKAAGAGSAAGPIGAAVAVVVAVIVIAFTGETKKVNVVSFSCNPWSAPVGGADCEKCNTGDGDFPCTEYKCQSLGQACELENKGTKEEICIWKNRTDIRPPEIRPWVEALTTGYNYNPDNTIAGADRGVKIIPGTNITGCIAPWTPITFGVTLDKPGKCKIDVRNKGNYSAMSSFFGGSSTIKYNHSMTLPPFPSNGSLSSENASLQNGGKITIYTRCQSVNGHSTVANFIFNFCVDQGPDRTPPKIIDTSIRNGAPISFGKTSVPLQVYVNEPSDCKWSHLDKSYDDMENQMSCVRSASEFNAQMLYSCSTTLDGLKDRQDNDFYFRCKDQPHLEGTNNSHERTTNAQSYKFVLKGTQPLVLDSAGPNNTVTRDSTSPIKVTLTAKTSAGFKAGEAICSYRNTVIASSGAIDFFKTGTFNHSQELWLTTGNYSYEIQCVDLGGNVDNKTISFRVETDTAAPVVARVFRQANQLKVITNEEGMCVYDTKGCDYGFSDGINMSKAVNGTEHSTAWDINKVFYIKCADKYGNQPLPNQCNIVAKPFEMK